MDKLQDKPFALIGVNGLPHQPGGLKAVMAGENLNWRSFDDDDGEIWKQWNSPATPAYCLIDHQGTIRHKWTGNPGEKTLDAILDKLIAEAEQAAPAK